MTATAIVIVLISLLGVGWTVACLSFATAYGVLLGFVFRPAGCQWYRW